jgi:molybdopterin synthase catalytic subunit
MAIDVQILSEALHWPERLDSQSGAVVRFTGVVRDKEDGQSISGLDYEAYRTMAELQIRQILEEIRREYFFHEAVVLHRIGFVPAGEAAVLVEVRSSHRGEAFDAVRIFMERLKQDVPIWKIGAK